MNPRPLFPEHGRPRADIKQALERMKQGDADWRNGRVPLYVFGATPDVAEIGRAGFMAYFAENALGGHRAFKSLERMEEEVIGMGLDLFHAPPEAVGNMTSGGTESIVTTVKAARDWARAHLDRPGHQGNLVLPVTAHPAFDKAAQLMDLEVRRMPVGPNLRADARAMADAVDSDTILIVGSVPCFPYGVIDPLPDLSELALSRGLWLHVDACVGGYIGAFCARHRQTNLRLYSHSRASPPFQPISTSSASVPNPLPPCSSAIPSALRDEALISTCGRADAS